MTIYAQYDKKLCIYDRHYKSLGFCSLTVDYAIIVVIFGVNDKTPCDNGSQAVLCDDIWHRK